MTTLLLMTLNSFVVSFDNGLCAPMKYVRVRLYLYQYVTHDFSIAMAENIQFKKPINGDFSHESADISETKKKEKQSQIAHYLYNTFSSFIL